MSSCLHCPDHCPPPVVPDDDLRLPPFPRPGGGTGSGTTTDTGFYRTLAGVYAIARSRYPEAPAQAVLRANPDVSLDRLRRAVHRTRQLGLLDRARGTVTPQPVTGAAPAPEPDPEPVTVVDDAERVRQVLAIHRSTGKWPSSGNLYMLKVARDGEHAGRLLDAARKVHAST